MSSTTADEIARSDEDALSIVRPRLIWPSRVLSSRRRRISMDATVLVAVSDDRLIGLLLIKEREKTDLLPIQLCWRQRKCIKILRMIGLLEYIFKNTQYDYPTWSLKFPCDFPFSSSY